MFTKNRIKNEKVNHPFGGYFDRMIKRQITFLFALQIFLKKTPKNNGKSPVFCTVFFPYLIP